jgi:hypothetical protein
MPAVVSFSLHQNPDFWPQKSLNGYNDKLTAIALLNPSFNRRYFLIAESEACNIPIQSSDSFY